MAMAMAAFSCFLSGDASPSPYYSSQRSSWISSQSELLSSSPRYQTPLLPHRRASVLHVRAAIASSEALSQKKSASSHDAYSALSQVCAVLGTQWGDEGKGKLVDILAERYDIVARCQVLPLSLSTFFFVFPMYELFLRMLR